MNDGEASGAWWAAASCDSSLRVPIHIWPAVLRKLVRVRRFRQSALFNALARGEPTLWTGVPIGLRDGGPVSLKGLATMLESALPTGNIARVRTSQGCQLASMRDVMTRWRTQRHIFSVTDLHYIKTRFDNAMNTEALNSFNLLERGPYAWQSQDSLVVSAAAAVTDSHSDDHSGSNHCFLGRKVWLFWDTAEGLAQGLEDVERCDVADRARFDVEVFAGLRSSRWLVIGPGETIFVPGHLTHKVVTLEPYIGLGSFFLAAPSAFDALLRWEALPPVWADPTGRDKSCSVPYVVRSAVRRLRPPRGAARTTQQTTYIQFLKRSLRTLSQRKTATLMRGPGRQLVETVLGT